MAIIINMTMPPSIGSPGGGSPGCGGAPDPGPANADAPEIIATKTCKILFGTIFIRCKSK